MATVIDGTTGVDAPGYKQSGTSLRSVVQSAISVTGAVATGTTTIPADDTIPQSTEGDQYMTAAFTPTNASNKLRVDVVWIGANSATGQLAAALFKDSETDARAAAVEGISGGDMACLRFSYEMTAGTTSAITFKVRAGLNNAGTTTFNGRTSARLFGGVMASSIQITEMTP